MRDEQANWNPRAVRWVPIGKGQMVPEEFVVTKFADEDELPYDVRVAVRITENGTPECQEVTFTQRGRIRKTEPLGPPVTVARVREIPFASIVRRAPELVAHKAPPPPGSERSARDDYDKGEPVEGWRVAEEIEQGEEK